MHTATHHTHHGNPTSFRGIILLSAWGFALVAASFLFLKLGILVDEWLGTAPKFMFLLLFLAIIGCFVELIQEVLRVLKNR